MVEEVVGLLSSAIASGNFPPRISAIGLFVYWPILVRSNRLQLFQIVQNPNSEIALNLDYLSH